MASDPLIQVVQGLTQEDGLQASTLRPPERRTLVARSVAPGSSLAASTMITPAQTPGRRVIRADTPSSIELFGTGAATTMCRFGVPPIPEKSQERWETDRLATQEAQREETSRMVPKKLDEQPWLPRP